MYQTSKQIQSIFILGAALLSANAFFVQGKMLGVIAFAIYFFGLTTMLASLLKKKDVSYAVSSLLSLIWFILIGTVTYYLHGITGVTTQLIIWLPALLLFLPMNHYELPIPKWKKDDDRTNIYTVFFILSQIALLGTLIANRTDALLRSPWHVVSPQFFVIYALSAGLLLTLLYRTKNNLVRFLSTSLFFFTTYSVAAIVYKIGFGFDAFIHRATENWIQAYGFIDPKQPYYIGQYSFVVWLSNVTALPVHYIDVYLVPVLASITLPAFISTTVKKVWDIPNKFAYGLSLLFLFVPFFSLHLTTPYNLAIIFSILTVIFGLGYLKNKNNYVVPVATGLVTLAAHPLLGAPLAVFVIYAYISKRAKNHWGIAAAVTFDVALVVPGLFVIQQLLAGLGLPELTNPFTKLDHFFELFTRPYWYLEKSSFVLETLYTWQLLIPVSYLLITLVGLYLKRKDKSTYLFAATALGLVIGAWFLRSWIVFTDVVSYEQGDYPLRMLKASLFFLLPITSYGLYELVKRINLRWVVLCASILLMLSFYLSYPQNNHKARFPGLNVTASDVEAVEMIHNENEDFDYIVLSNQLVSAAALQRYSFAKYHQTETGEIFYYSIPTGGELYRLYGRMLYEGQKNEYMQEAMKLANVNKAYFVVNKYWANSDQIIEGAKASAKSFKEIDGEIWIFEY
jgi:hypothetical protein